MAYYRSALAVARGDYAAAERVLRELRAAQIESQFYRALTSRALGGLATVRGKLAEAERHFRDAMDAAEQQRSSRHYLTAVINLGYRDVAIRDTPQAGIRRLEEALALHPLQTMAPLDRPYIELATFFALAGRPDRARALRTEHDSVIPAELHQLWDPVGGKHVLAGAIAVAEKQYDDAVAEFRLADRGPCRHCMLPYLGRAYDLAGESDSTIMIYERYLAIPHLFRVYPPVPAAGGVGDALFLAPIHKRLGELFEERGNRAKAAEHYARLVELWKDADLELRPTVADVRRRLARLSGERPQ